MMIYIQRPVKYAGFAGKSTRKTGLAWVAVAAMVCALIIWVAVQIHGLGSNPYSMETRFPRNTVDMHGTYTGAVRPLPWFGC
ncbi:MAG: hypothetical protein FWD25_11400 [Clostridia bacterium]|nr:hypothetical protein [Clostridia bacterium]